MGWQCFIMNNKIIKTTREQERPLELLIRQAQALPEPENEYSGKTSSDSSTPDNILLFHRRQLRGADRFINIHHRHVLICCLETAGKVIIDEHTIILEPGNSILLFPLQFHHYIIPQNLINWLYITFELPDNLWLQPLNNRLVPINKFSIEILAELVSDWQASQDNSGWCSETVRSGLGYFLARQIQSAPKEPVFDTTDQTEYGDGTDDSRLAHSARLLQRINKYIHDNIAGDLSLRKVAEHMNVSTSHLRVMARTQLGIGLANYIRQVRIKHAQRLLINTRAPIDYISEKCGFRAQGTFSRAFRDLTGISPMQFRQRNKSGKQHGRK